MDLFIQVQCVAYSTLYGFCMCALYHVLNRISYSFWIFRYIFQMIIGCAFAFIYYYGLVYFNEGVLRLYFFVFMFLGYALYQKYYAYYLLYWLEKCFVFIKRIIQPFIFFFHSINVIMKKRMKKVRLKWQKRKQE